MPTCNDCTIITQDNPLLSVSSKLPSQISLWSFWFHFSLLFFWSEFLGGIIDPHWNTGRCCKRPRYRNAPSQCKHSFWKHGKSLWDHAKNMVFSTQYNCSHTLWGELFECFSWHIFTCSSWSHCRDPVCLMCPEDSVPYFHPWERGPWRWWRSPDRWGGTAGRWMRSRRSPARGRRSSTLPGIPALSYWLKACKRKNWWVNFYSQSCPSFHLSATLGGWEDSVLIGGPPHTRFFTTTKVHGGANTCHKEKVASLLLTLQSADDVSHLPSSLAQKPSCIPGSPYCRPPPFKILLKKC